MGGEVKSMVYTDKIHMVADSLEELHDFATHIGLKRNWFQNHSRHPHYDLWGTRLESALNRGAVVVDSKEIVRISHRLNCGLSGSGISKQSWNNPEPGSGKDLRSQNGSS
jgi:hypothetical protein